MFDSKELEKELARRSLLEFSKYVGKHYFSATWFHTSLYERLDSFLFDKRTEYEIEKGLGVKLNLCVPPQHGKTTCAANAASYMLGIKPDTNVIIVSYNDKFASNIMKDIKRTISSKEYKDLFPNTRFAEPKDKSLGYENTSRKCDIYDNHGSLICSGIKGGISGYVADLIILDDPYRGLDDASSKAYRDTVMNFYTGQIVARMNSGSQDGEFKQEPTKLITIYTRWNELDLIGELLKTEKDLWEVVKYHGLKTNEYTVPEDPREIGEPLWSIKKNKATLERIREDSPSLFNAMYQQEPKATTSYLVNVKYYDEIPKIIDRVFCYIDPSDSGKDSTCAVLAAYADDKIYIYDVFFSNKPLTSEIENLGNKINEWVKINFPDRIQMEINKGGEILVKQLMSYIDEECVIEMLHQSKNKISRIMSHLPFIECSVLFSRSNKSEHYLDFIKEITEMEKVDNRVHDDAIDCVVGVCEDFLSNKDISVTDYYRNINIT